MTRFIDGPAKEQALMIKRAPFFLRVTEEDGKFDALDQSGDEPRPGEKLFAYKMVGKPSMCQINLGGGRGGFYPMAEYRLVTNQPTDHEMRYGWIHWCESQPEAANYK